MLLIKNPDNRDFWVKIDHPDGFWAMPSFLMGKYDPGCRVIWSIWRRP